jgi:hypothetical protein
MDQDDGDRETLVDSAQDSDASSVDVFYRKSDAEEGSDQSEYEPIESQFLGAGSLSPSSRKRLSDYDADNNFWNFDSGGEDNGSINHDEDSDEDGGEDVDEDGGEDGGENDGDDDEDRVEDGGEDGGEDGAEDGDGDDDEAGDKGKDIGDDQANQKADIRAGLAVAKKLKYTKDDIGHLVNNTYQLSECDKEVVYIDGNISRKQKRKCETDMENIRNKQQQKSVVSMSKVYLYLTSYIAAENL